MSPSCIHKEVVTWLIVVNIVRIIMLEAAIKNAVDSLRINFIYVVRAIIMFALA